MIPLSPPPTLTCLTGCTLDWIVNQGNILNTNQNGGELVLTLTQANAGTRISSTRYMHYGTVTTRSEFGVVPASSRMSA